MIAVEPLDLENRRMAASELRHNVVVSAGAGTGKTRLLIDRLTLLIVGEKTPVDRIVALTFTKKAAEEMRDRLEKRLREIVADPRCVDLLNLRYPATDEERTRLSQKALDDIPKAQIGTIHSFAGHLLRLYPVQAQVDPAFREDDGTSFAALFESEWISWLGEELTPRSSRAGLWARWLADIDMADLKELARSMAGRERPADVPGAPVSLKAFADETRGWLDSLQERLGIPAKTRSFAPRLESIRRVLDAAVEGRRPSPNDVAEIESLRKAKLPAEWSGDPEAVERMPVIVRRASALADVDEGRVAAACDAVRPFAERFRRELGRRGILSFDDLLVKARNLVRDHPKVRAALKRQFSTFLVDEFQDTDPLQGEILFYLAEQDGFNAADWRDIRLGPGRLFVVGDPKQSIYRFRGADIAAFEEFWNRLVQQGALKATLSSNFRSRRHIIEAVNGVFPPNMRQQAYLQPAYEHLETGRSDVGGDGCEIISISVPDGAEAKAEELRIFEAGAVADWIEKHAGTKVGGEPLTYSGVAILLRGTSAFGPYLDALRERGIPFLAEGERTYYHRPEVLEFTNLLAVLADPDDRLSLAGVLRSPLGGINDAELAELAAAGGLDYRRHPPFFKDRVGPLYEALRRLAGLVTVVPVTDLIREAFDATWLLEIAAGRRHGEQAVANLRKVALLAEKWLESEPMSLPALVRRLRDYREDKKDEGENPLADVQFDAVRVMTIHKAKGLEFPVVFLPNLGAASGKGAAEPDVLVNDWRTGLSGVRVPGSGAVNAARVLIDDDITRRELAEEVRVFYVAMTRAKERLVMLVREDEPAGSFAKYLTRSGCHPAGDCDSVKAGKAVIPSRRLNWAPHRAPQGRRLTGEFTGNWKLTELPDILRRRRDEWAACRAARSVLTPTALMNDAGAASEPEKRLLSVDDEADLDRTPAIMVGHICHSVMERWDFGGSDASSSVRLEAAIEDAARHHGLLPENPDRVRIIDDAGSILQTFLSSEPYRRLAAAHREGRLEARELPFLFPLGTGDGPRFMRGVMDVVYREDRTIVVGDYKTNRVDDGNLDAVIAKYASQGSAYVRAIKEASGMDAVFELIFLRTGRSVRLKG